jgi:hypothetical protein
MNKVLRISIHCCILLALGLFFGCSDDDPASVPPPQPDPNPAGSVGVYVDEAGTNPNVVDNGGIVTLYVVHTVTEGVTASAFMIEAPAGWTRTGDVSEYPVNIGNINAGITIGYGECLTGAIHVMTLTYQAPGNTAAGESFKVLPHTDPRMSGDIEAVDCSQNKLLDGIGIVSPVTNAP